MAIKQLYEMYTKAYVTVLCFKGCSDHLIGVEH